MLQERGHYCPFSPAEFRDRRDRVIRGARAAGLETLVVTDPANICYLTGYDGSSWYVPQAAIVSMTGAEPVLVVRAQDVAGASWVTQLPRENIVGYDESYLFDGRDAISVVGDVLIERGWANGVVGTEMNSPGLPPSRLTALRRSLPKTQLSDASGVVNWVRSVKTPAELEVMRVAGRISDRAMALAIDAIVPGTRDDIVAAQVVAALIEGVDGLHGSRPALPVIAGGPRSNSPHIGWTGDSFQVGEPAVIELAGHRHNYAAGLSRTLFLGEPPKQYRELADVVEGGLEAAIGALRAGRAAFEVEEAWRQYTSPRGYEKKSRIGYSLGLSFPYSLWIENTISIAAGQTSVLRAGMTIHLMVAIWLEEVGYWLSESFVVTDGAPERLSQLPRTLTVKHVS